MFILVLINLLTTVITRYINEMVPNFKPCASAKRKEKVSSSSLVNNISLFWSFLVQSLVATMLKICIFNFFINKFAQLFSTGIMLN